jgi:hypothetical protein
MADEPSSAAPAAAAVPAAATPAAVSSPAQPQRREINVSAIPAPTTPITPPKKGSAQEKMLENLRGKAKPEPGTAAPEPTTAAATAPVEGDEPEVPAEGDEPAAPAEGTKPADKKKVNPWKLVDEYKAKVKEYEGKIAEVEKRAIPESKWKEQQETLTQREARLKELEEEIRYVNYSKSDEFKNKYQKPYDDAWKRAMGELKELTIEAGDGNTRPVEPKDILDLVNLPLPMARKEAVEKFGEFADDVMAHRKEIRKLFDEQSAALEEARTNGEAREKETAEARKKEVGEMTGTIREQWSKANEDAASHPKYGTYFKPVEGDEQGNQRLAKGFELADRAFSENPLSKGLTPEQRTAIVQRHAAVRNRCAAFGRLVYMNETKASEIAELKKQLAEFNGAEPPADGGSAAPASPPGTKGMAGVLEDLRKRAK